MQNKYPMYIMRKVRTNLGLDADDTSQDETINSMSNDEVFGRVLEWEGIIGYNRRIMSIVEDVFGVELKGEPT